MTGFYMKYSKGLKWVKANNNNTIYSLDSGVTMLLILLALSYK